MRKALLLTITALLFTACGGGETTDTPDTPKGVNQASPAAVVQAVFDAANSEDFSNLKDLCDPDEDNDQDTREICKLADNPEKSAEFVEYFKSGKINGSTINTSSFESKVPVMIGPDAKDEEEIELVKRGEKWYLYAF